MVLGTLPLEWRLLDNLHSFPFGAVITRDTTPIAEQAYRWLETHGYIELVVHAKDEKRSLLHDCYVLTDWGKHAAWQMATGHYCGTCYWWQQRCTIPVTPSTVNCGDTKWHQLCEQWAAKD